MSIVLAIPDIHAPFQHPKTIEFLQYVYNHFKCDRVVCLGDEMDFHAISRWPKDPDGHGAGLEFSFGGVQYMQTKKDRIFGMNAGCLIDQEAYAFKYARTMPQKPTIGCGVIINGIHAFFIPLHEG